MCQTHVGQRQIQSRKEFRIVWVDLARRRLRAAQLQIAEVLAEPPLGMGLWFATEFGQLLHSIELTLQMRVDPYLLVVLQLLVLHENAAFRLHVVVDEVGAQDSLRLFDIYIHDVHVAFPIAEYLHVRVPSTSRCPAGQHLEIVCDEILFGRFLDAGQHRGRRIVWYLPGPQLPGVEVSQPECSTDRIETEFPAIGANGSDRFLP